MFRPCKLLPVRVICLTMIPNGGAMTAALKKLGYEPYTLRSAFASGRASTHLNAWAMCLDGEKPMDMSLLTDFDAIVGPPGAVVYDKLLHACPPYAKVILVEEPDKEGWAAAYDKQSEDMLVAAKRTARSRVGRSCLDMLSKMVVSNEKLGRAAALEIYEERVKGSVPAQKLLVYRYGDGWEPLCEFLERPIPKDDEPFPPYEDGRNVIGSLQERLEFAVKLTYIIGFLTACTVLFSAIPGIEWIKETFSELRRDYELSRKSKLSDEEIDELKGTTSKGSTSAEKFDSHWEKLGGSVRVFKDEKK